MCAHVCADFWEGEEPRRELRGRAGVRTGRRGEEIKNKSEKDLGGAKMVFVDKKIPLYPPFSPSPSLSPSPPSLSHSPPSLFPAFSFSFLPPFLYTRSPSSFSLSLSLPLYKVHVPCHVTPSLPSAPTGQIFLSVCHAMQSAEQSPGSFGILCQAFLDDFNQPGPWRGVCRGGFERRCDSRYYNWYSMTCVHG